MSSKDLEAGFDDALRVEEGRVHEKSTTWDTLDSLGATTLNGTIQSKGSRFQSVVSNTASVGRAFLPRLSSSRADFVVSRLESYPQGYPRVSQLMSSDENWMFYRGFHRLHSRIILHKQDKLRELEEQLEAQDDIDNEKEDTQKYIRSRDECDYQEYEDGTKSRQDILQESEKLLLEYTTLLESAHKMQSFNKPSNRDHKSVSNYFSNEAPLFEDDGTWIKQKEDLVSIRAGRDHGFLDAAVESFLRWYPCAPVKMIFCDETARQKSNDTSIHYFSRGRIAAFCTLIITTLILILLVVPIWVLFWLSTHEAAGAGDVIIIAVLLISTLVFSCVISLFTKARRHELLAASATYCAILVVFVAGNNGSTPPP